MSADAWTHALQRFVDALNRPRDPAALTAAVTDDIHIDRHRPGERRAAPIAETFTGLAAVAAWFARTPPATQFSLAGAPTAHADGSCTIEYAIAAGEFHNGGIWIARLAGDGRIAFLSHHPFALRAAR